MVPFGIKSAPEIYQRIMDQMLEGILGASAIMDVILVAADTVEERVIEKATEYNLKMNFEKCMIRQTRVSYIGYILSEKC